MVESVVRCSIRKCSNSALVIATSHHSQPPPHASAEPLAERDRVSERATYDLLSGEYRKGPTRSHAFRISKIRKRSAKVTQPWDHGAHWQHSSPRRTREEVPTTPSESADVVVAGEL